MAGSTGRGGLWRQALDWGLMNVQAGSLALTDPSGQLSTFAGTEPGPHADITLKNWRVLRRLLTGGHVGFAEGYMAGDYETSDLVALLTWAMRNELALTRFWSGAWLSRAAAAVQHVLRRNTPSGSKRNIQAHYDLGNDFYAHWLDRGMNYSSAMFQASGQSLEEAQSAKLNRVVSLLAPKRGARILEIGCGWGPLAERLAQFAGCHVTGVTLSATQLSYAKQRTASLSPAPNLMLADYRSLDDRFDGIASIEMIEAVGERYWPTYFDTIRRCLKPGGNAVLQAITIDETYYSAYRNHPDFIQKHIFPGGMLPTLTILRQQIATAGLALCHTEHFGMSYAQTLVEWRERFWAALPQLRALGFDDAFCRKWDYYFAYCETGFRLGTLNVSLLQIAGLQSVLPHQAAAGPA